MMTGTAGEIVTQAKTEVKFVEDMTEAERLALAPVCMYVCVYVSSTSQ